MADRTIKPDDTHDLVLQNNDGSAKIEVNEAQTVVLTGGSTTALTIDASGDTTLAGTANDIGTVTSGTFNGTLGSSASFASATFPAGHILRAFYDESDTTVETFAEDSETAWGELELTITGTNNTSDYLQVTVGLNGIYNEYSDPDNVMATLWVGVVWDVSSNFDDSPTAFGGLDYYTRTLMQSQALNLDSMITIRAVHPTTSTYYVRAKIKAVSGDLNINQSSTRSTINAFEIKG